MRIAWPLALSLVACSSSPKTTVVTHTLKLGSLIDVTGTDEYTTAPVAVNLAVSDFNTALAQSTSFAADKVSIQIMDTQATIAIGVPDALYLVQDAGAVALVVSTNGDTIRSNYLLNYDAGGPGVPIVGFADNSSATVNPNATVPEGGDPLVTLATQNDGGWVFRTINAQLQSLEGLPRLAAIHTPSLDVNGDGKVHLSQAVLANNDADFRTMGGALSTLTTLPTSFEQIDIPTSPTVPNPNSFNFNDLGTWLTDDLDESVCSPCSETDCTCATGMTPAAAPIPDFVVVACPGGLVGPIYSAVKTLTTSIPVYTIWTFRENINLTNLGSAANGAEGTAYPPAQVNANGQTFLTEMKAQNTNPDELDSRAYDAAATIMLATVYAAHANSLTALDQVTGAMIKDGLNHINDKSSGAQPVGTGPAEFLKGINYLAAGTPIDYDGAGSPCDFDPVYQSAVNDFEHFSVQNEQFVDMEYFDCVSDPSCPCKSNGSFTCATGE